MKLDDFGIVWGPHFVLAHGVDPVHWRSFCLRHSRTNHTKGAWFSRAPPWISPEKGRNPPRHRLAWLLAVTHFLLLIPTTGRTIGDAPSVHQHRKSRSQSSNTATFLTRAMDPSADSAKPHLLAQSLTPMSFKLVKLILTYAPIETISFHIPCSSIFHEQNPTILGHLPFLQA